ncbi:erythromycin esterase family protein [Nocardia thailandica]|uniref:erythromycin esterase family protein n=1 Tax=Nocardia thailandica TaxID=257275 RepID=UPI003570EE22
MLMTTALPAIGRPAAARADLARALDDLLAARPVPPAVLALGEPTHGIPAFPLLRNDVLAHLADRGFRSIVLETDVFAAALVDDYVTGADTDLETVLATGLSHRFGNVPGNRELLEWLRAHNAAREPADRIRFHGFDAPLEQTEVPSPRAALTTVAAFLPPARRPASAADLDTLIGDDAAWTDPAAVYDPALSIGDSDRARALRLVADDLTSALRRLAPALRPADPAAYDRVLAHARTAKGLLRYHAALAAPGPDRIALLLSLRTEMMADNLRAVLGREQDRGPTLVFAHNVHLQRTDSRMTMGGAEPSWSGAGAILATELGERYVVVATDANPRPEPGTLQHVLAAATTGRALFPAAELRAALDPALTAGAPIVQGHIPLGPEDLAGADAVVFVADTDGVRHPYW